MTATRTEGNYLVLYAKGLNLLTAVCARVCAECIHTAAELREEYIETLTLSSAAERRERSLRSQEERVLCLCAALEKALSTL